MDVLVSGSSGLIGTALVPALRGAGHRVTRLVRREPRLPDEAAWDPDRGELDPGLLAGVGAVVHLGGVGIGDRRWTERQRARILGSRVGSTALLAAAVGRAAAPPALVVASGVGYYGNRGDELLTEQAAAGGGFLAEVCAAWEQAADPARAAGARVVHLRTGIVLSSRGGALGRLLPLFRAGLGGRLGSGRQYWSWIALDDLLALYRFAVENPVLEGPVNAVAPDPVTNRAFTRALAQVLGRPAVLPVPAVGPRLLLGQMAEELLLYSQRAAPAAAQQAGFEFSHPHLVPALRAVLDARG